MIAAGQAIVIRWLTITAGTIVGAMGVMVFLAPFDIAPGGMTGLAVILNRLVGTPIGMMILIGNIPILYLGYRMLGGWQVVAWTVYVTILYSFAVDVLALLLPIDALSDDRLLNTLYGGIGSGLIYRSGATFGGTSMLARILQIRYGLPLSNTYMYANILVVFLAGVFLGWESALYAMIVLSLEGIASDYVMEGPSVIRTVTIITEQPEEVSHTIMHEMNRGVTSWEATGMYTHQMRHVLFVTIARTQVAALRQLVLSIDSRAFIVVGQRHVAYGEGFKSPKLTLTPHQDKSIID